MQKMNVELNNKIIYLSEVEQLSGNNILKRLIQEGEDITLDAIYVKLRSQSIRDVFHKAQEEGYKYPQIAK